MTKDADQVWYHGSPLRLCTLQAGSTVTMDVHLAEAFSHKPSLVSLEDDGAVRHNSREPGLLYRVAEALGPGDVTPHPQSSMPPGLEYLTTRDLALALVGPVPIRADELLSEAAAELTRAAPERKAQEEAT